MTRGYWTIDRLMDSRLAAIIYFVVLLAASVAAFGVPVGIVASLFVAVVWRMALLNRFRIGCLEWTFVLLVPGAMMFAVAISSLLRDGHGDSNRQTCSNNLRQFTLALAIYAQSKGQLPQAIVSDPDGRPLHSWRIAIMPRIEQAELAEAYDWTEPWNSRHNAQLLMAPIEIFRCPSDRKFFQEKESLPTTNYFAVVGPQTAWPPDRGMAFDEITDGRDQTILLLEAAGLNVPWGEPRDLSYEEALEILTSVSDERIAHRDGINAAFASGTVRFLPVPMKREMAEALLTAHGGDQFDWNNFEHDARPKVEPLNRIAPIAFVIVALAPAFRLLRKRPA